MKKFGPSISTLILTLLAILLSGTSIGQIETQIYGRANITVNRVNMESLLPQQEEWQLNSNASRIGLKGSYRINSAIEAIYQVEFETHFDDGKSSTSKGKDTLEQRNIFAGFRGNFGQIIAGKHDSPLKTVAKEVDRFNDQVLGDIKSFMEGEDRVSNLIMYTTPNWNGFSATMALLPPEDSTGSSGNGDLAGASSMSFDYSNDFVTAAIAFNDDVDKQDLTRLMTNFYLGSTEIGFLWQQADRIDMNADEKSWLISAEHKLDDNWRLKVQYGRTEYSVLDNEDEQFALGLERTLNSTAFIFINFVRDDRDKTIASYSDSSLAIGFQLKF